jgi:hypothetical protein
VTSVEGETRRSDGGAEGRSEGRAKSRGPIAHGRRSRPAWDAVCLVALRVGVGAFEEWARFGGVGGTGVGAR